MGYYMNQRNANFRIKKENFPAALAAIKALAQKTELMNGGQFGGSEPERWFAWVDTKGFVNAETLVEAIGAWRWDAGTNNEGDIDSIMFASEKLGDEDVLFDALAPYVEPGSFIEMSGEDDSIWRWAFNGKTCESKAAKIVWD